MKRPVVFFLFGLVVVCAGFALLITRIVNPPIDWHAQTQAGAPPLCGSWQLISGENADGLQSEFDVRLDGVAAVSDNDVWVVGNKTQVVHLPDFGGPAERPQPLLLHWNGWGWSQVSIPDLEGLKRLRFTSIEIMGGDNVLIGGQFQVGDGVQTVILLREGGKWHRHLLPHVNETDDLFHAVSGTSPDDLWAVGSFAAFAAATMTSTQPIMHWDGNQWTVVDTGVENAELLRLTDVLTFSPKDVWAVGFKRMVDGPHAPASLHWNGSTWSEVSFPGPDPKYEVPPARHITSVAATSKDDLWAVGDLANGQVMLSYHWDGSAWKLVDVPEYTHGSLADVAVLADHQTAQEGAAGAEAESGARAGAGAQTHVWAVGQVAEPYDPVTERYPTHPHLMYRDGTGNIGSTGSTWNIPLPLKEWTGGVLNGVTVLPNGNVWAVGHYTVNSVQGGYNDTDVRALIVKYTAQTCPSTDG
ncbi:MAG TPA: hypothetical protein VF952_19245 [Chloroflexia bacterium]|jgi:hypothetical protein